ncbi:MAG: MFS transporter [Ignisphaera sp.]|nr:MFS transporter [Ignisphaera sp.]MDW8085691.1 MFS transporter [Ignisphaera sp.]
MAIARRSLTLILMIISLMMLYVDQNLVAPMLTRLREEGMIIGSGEEWYVYAGLVGTVPVLAGISTTMIWGYLADRLSRRTLFAAAVLIGEVPCFLTAFARNYYELLMLRALTGIGINGAAPVARAIIADLYPPEERGKGYAIYNFSTGFGVLFGMLMAGMALALGLSWRIPFALAAAPNFFIVPLFLLLVKEIKVGYAEPELKKLYDTGFEYRYGIRLRDFAVAFATTPTLVFIYLQGIPGTFPWGAIPYWAPTFFQKSWGLSEATSALIVFSAGLGMMVGYFVGGLLSDKLVAKGYRNSRLFIPFVGILLGAFTTLALLYYPYPYGEESLQSLLPVILIAVSGMVFVTWAAPSVPAVLSEVSLPEHRGTVFGIFNITDSIGSAFGPTVASILMAFYLSRGVLEPRNVLYGLATTVLFWIPCALLWLPAFRTYIKDREKMRKILAQRSSILQ